MGQRYKTPDGHVYEEQPGGGYALVDGSPTPPAGPQGIVTHSADPGLAVQRALQAAELAAKAREAANAPIATRKIVAETAEAEARAAEARAKAGASADPRRAQAMTDLNQDSTFRAITQAEGDLNPASGMPSSGFWSILRHIPGSNAQLLGSDLSTINAQNMLGKLGELKAQSATGASGMGALSDTEGRILRDSIANLDQSLPQDRLKANLQFLEQHYRRAAAITHGLNPDQVDLTNRTAAAGAPQSETQNQTLSRTGTQSVVDPTLKGIAHHLGSLVAQNVPDDQILAYMKSTGVDPAGTNINSILDYRRTNKDFQTWQRQNPGRAYPVGPSFYTKDVPLSGGRELINSAAQTGYGAGTVAAAESMTGNHLDNIAGALGGNAAQIRAGEDMLRQDHPYWSTAGDVAGQAADEFLLGRIPGAKMLLASKWGRRGADLAYGAASGQGAADDTPGSGAILGGILNAAGGMGGRGLQRGVGTAVSGMSDQTLRYLNARGIPMTIGQIARSGSDLGGKIVAGLEDRISGYPIIGDAIKSARLRGSEGLNRAAFNEGLAPIGKGTGKLTGAAAVDNMQNDVQQAYSGALDGVNMPADAQFGTEYAAAKQAAAAIPVHGAQLVHTLETSVEPYMQNGSLSGRDLQATIQRIRGESAAYNGLPGGQSASDALGGVEDAVHGLVQRQAPDVWPAYQAANEAYRNQQILQRAVNGQASELATPSSLRRASITNTTKYGGANQASSTDRPFYDLAANAQQVLPSTTPDSGSAGRWIIPSAAMALAGSAGAGTADNGEGISTGAKDAALGLGGALLLGSPYSKGGQKALQALLLGQRLKAITAAGDLIRQYPWLGGATGAALAREQMYPAPLPQ